MKQPAKASLLGGVIRGVIRGAIRGAMGSVMLGAVLAAGAARAGDAEPVAGAAPAAATDTPAQDAQLATLDGILAALYGTISGAAGEARNWDRLRSLFTHEGRMVVHGANKAGELHTRVLTVSDYISRVTPVFAREGFYESELARRTETFGQIAHVFSTYEARRAAGEGRPFMRGVNSIQLVNDGRRWWIQSLVWQAESDGSPLPERYLKNGQ